MVHLLLQPLPDVKVLKLLHDGHVLTSEKRESYRCAGGVDRSTTSVVEVSDCGVASVSTA